MADHNIQLGGVRGDPLLTPCQWNTGPQNTNPNTGTLEQLLDPALHVVLVGELHVHPDLPVLASLGLNQV